jgi:hypothetical protein
MRVLALKSECVPRSHCFADDGIEGGVVMLFEILVVSRKWWRFSFAVLRAV